MRPFELHYRASRDYTERADRREIGHQLIGHSIGEVFLVRISGEIIERENRNRFNRVRWCTKGLRRGGRGYPEIARVR